MKKQYYAGVAMAVLVFLIGSWWFVQRPDRSSYNRYGGTLRIGMFEKPTIIHPFYTTHSRSATMVSLIYRGLVTFDDRFNAVPDIAASWTVSDDGCVYTFTLRDGIRFHDGSECTAEDVKYTYDLVRDPATRAPYRAFFENIDRIVADDRLKVSFHLKKRQTTFIYSCCVGILPTGEMNGESVHASAIAKIPVGTGPFKFGGFKGKDVVLEAFDGYVDGRPYLDSVVFNDFSDRTGVPAMTIFKGEVDMVNFISLQQYMYTREDRRLRSYAITSDFYYALIFDENDRYLSDPDIRMALQYGFSRKAFIQDVFHGYAQPCFGPFVPTSAGYDGSVVVPSYDPQKARTLIESRGFTQQKNGMYYEKDGELLELRIAMQKGLQDHEKIAKSLTLAFARIGVRVVIHYYAMNDFAALEELRKRHVNGMFRMLCGGEPLYDTALEWHSQGNGRSCMLSASPSSGQLDALIAATEDIVDEKVRTQKFQEIYRLICHNRIALFLCYQAQFHTISARFKNVDAYFTAAMPEHEIKQFYVEGGEGYDD